uniref:Uncharacterized protein n=1 Tax=Timema shepardi TaxID=629360 RepID=A0A7R9AZV5_TIMSH|nr:unnamed protein product [Timema shepardi]
MSMGTTTKHRDFIVWFSGGGRSDFVSQMGVLSPEDGAIAAPKHSLGKMYTLIIKFPKNTNILNKRRLTSTKNEALLDRLIQVLWPSIHIKVDIHKERSPPRSAAPSLVAFYQQ